MKIANITKKNIVWFLRCLCLISLLSNLTFAPNAIADGSSRIVKWKDEKGATHYGDRIPAQYADHENSIINQQGITIKYNKPINYHDEELDRAKLEQDKKDKALLSAFTNENEIDLARERNMQLDKVAIEGLQLQKLNSQKRLAENQKYADNYIKRKKPIPADLSTDIKTNQDEIAKQDKLIIDHKLLMENTQKRFDDDRKRYISLKNHTSITTDLSVQTPSSKP